MFAVQSLYGDGRSALAESLRAGLRKGREKMETALRHADVPEQNGWQLTYHAFDYCRQSFERVDRRRRTSGADGRRIWVALSMVTT